MNWPREYLAAIQRGEIVASRKVRAVYEREVSWMTNPPPDFPYYFDEDTGQRPIDFIERYCKQSKSPWIGKPVELMLFQKAKFQLAFGWLNKETHMRRFRYVVDIRGRKNGKSTETAGIAQYMLIADGEGGAEVYCVANKLDQAKAIFTEAVNMRTQSPGLLSLTKKRQSDIYYPDTFGFIKALASDTSTMDGLNASFFVQDEFHEARDSKLYDVMVQSQSSREQPLAWLISTNGFVREGFFDAKFKACSSIAMWEPGFEDYRTLPLIYELDSRDEWTKPECWEKSNPGLGIIKKRETMIDFVDTAKRDPSFLPAVMTKDFNLPENSSTAWLPYESCVNESITCGCEDGHWQLCQNGKQHETLCRVCGKPLIASIGYLYDTYAVGGCDLSSTTDLTCATLLVRRPNDPNFYVLQKYFLPRARIDATEASNAREAPYRLWAEQGWLHICEGSTVDYRAVTQWFVDMSEKHKITPLWVGYDRALAGYWQQEMAEAGFSMEKIPQGPFVFSYPMKQLGGLLTDHRVVYQDNPVLRFCLVNTESNSANRSGIDTIQPAKAAANKRIDGMVSLLNSFVCYLNHEDEYSRYVR